MRHAANWQGGSPIEPDDHREFAPLRGVDGLVSSLRSMSLALICAASLYGCATETTIKTEEGDPDQRADVHAQLAAQYMERNSLEVALEELNRALAVKPDHSRSNYVMAVLQTRLKDYDAADRYYKRALKSDPDNSEAAHDYGILLCEQGNIDQALKSFEQALSNPLYRGTSLTNLRAGECLITKGDDPAAAEKYFRQVLALNPAVQLALYYMAEINFDRGNYLSARAFVERFFGAGPETPQSLLLAAKIETRLDADEVAQDYARRLRSKFPSSEQATQLKGL